MPWQIRGIPLSRLECLVCEWKKFIIDILYYAMVNKMGYDEYSSQISGVHRAVSMLQIGKEKNKSNKL